MNLFKVDERKITYNGIAPDRDKYTNDMDKSYDIMSKMYNVFMFIFPLWKRWISSVLPHIEGSKILEVSFGPGYLLGKCAGNYDCYGIDFNKNMLKMADERLKKKNLTAELQLANVESLPYEDESFDTVINTMAFTGYPDGKLAIREMVRVLKSGGKLLLVDFDYPENRNVFGCNLVKMMERGGDLIKNIEEILKDEGLDYIRNEIGGFGSVHQYVIKKF